MFFDYWKRTPEQDCAVGDFDFLLRLYLETVKLYNKIENNLSDDQKIRNNWEEQRKKFKTKFTEPFEKWSGKTLKGGVFYDLC